jgi:hypothetical protein
LSAHDGLTVRPAHLDALDESLSADHRAEADVLIPVSHAQPPFLAYLLYHNAGRQTRRREISRFGHIPPASAEGAGTKGGSGTALLAFPAFCDKIS